jgi:hypothetical protein
MEAKPPIRYRKLRIAWSVGWGIIALLLCVVYAMSFRWTVGASGTNGKEYIYFDVIFGEFMYSRIVPVMNTTPVRWRRFSHAITDADYESYVGRSKPKRHALGLHWALFGNGWQVSVSLWMPPLIVAGIAMVPWIRRRSFSLRMLLIGTAILAILLGLTVISN